MVPIGKYCSQVAQNWGHQTLVRNEFHEAPHCSCACHIFVYLIICCYCCFNLACVALTTNIVQVGEQATCLIHSDSIQRKGNNPRKKHILSFTLVGAAELLPLKKPGLNMHDVTVWAYAKIHQNPNTCWILLNNVIQNRVLRCSSLIWSDFVSPLAMKGFIIGCSGGQSWDEYFLID